MCTRRNQIHIEVPTIFWAFKDDCSGVDWGQVSAHGRHVFYPNWLGCLHNQRWSAAYQHRFADGITCMTWSYCAVALKVWGSCMHADWRCKPQRYNISSRSDILDRLLTWQDWTTWSGCAHTLPSISEEVMKGFFIEKASKYMQIWSPA